MMEQLKQQYKLLFSHSIGGSPFVFEVSKCPEAQTLAPQEFSSIWKKLQIILSPTLQSSTYELADKLYDLMGQLKIGFHMRSSEAKAILREVNVVGTNKLLPEDSLQQEGGVITMQETTSGATDSVHSPSSLRENEIENICNPLWYLGQEHSFKHRILLAKRSNDGEADADDNKSIDIVSDHLLHFDPLWHTREGAKSITSVSKSKYVTGSDFSIVLGLFAFVAFMLWLIFGGKKKRKRVDGKKNDLEDEMKQYKQRGFGNLSNTCYLGVSLQSFLSLDCLKLEFDQAIHLGPITTALKEVLYGHDEEDGLVGSITPLVQSLESTNHRLNIKKDGSILALFKDIMEDIINAENPSISGLFKTYIKQVISFDCGYSSPPEERTNTHIYMLKLIGKGESITEALNGLFTVQKINSKRECPHCTHTLGYKIDWLLLKPASVLVLELEYKNKSSRHVKFDEILTIYPTSCVPRDLEEGVPGKIEYQLKSVIQQRRVRKENHFVAFVRRIFEGTYLWFEADDAIVRRVEFEDVLKVKGVTVLVYELM